MLQLRRSTTCLSAFRQLSHRIEKHEHDAWAAAHALNPAFVCYDEATDTCYFPLAELSEERMERVVALVARVTSSGKVAVRAEYSNLAISGEKRAPGKLLAGLTAGSLGQPDYELASIGKRRDWWASVSKEYPLLAAAARRVLALHPTSAAAERNWSAWGRRFPANRAGMAVSTGMKANYVQVNNGDAHDGIDRELMLSLMGEDEPAGELAEHEGQA
jgi:hypothetical protein